MDNLLKHIVVKVLVLAYLCFQLIDVVQEVLKGKELVESDSLFIFGQSRANFLYFFNFLLNLATMHAAKHCAQVFAQTDGFVFIRFVALEFVKPQQVAHLELDVHNVDC